MGGSSGADDAEGVSDSCLFYLFADRLIPAERTLPHALGEIAVPVPGTNRLVPLGNLERHLLAVAVLGLQSLGAVTLTYHPWESPKGLRLRRTGTVEVPLSLEARLLTMLGDEEMSLWQLVINRWMSAGAFPLNAVVAEAQIEAMRAGCIGRPDTPEIIPGFLGNHTFPPVATDLERLDALEPDLEILAARWRHASGEGDLVKQLLRECNKALYNARPAQRGNF